MIAAGGRLLALAGPLLLCAALVPDPARAEDHEKSVDLPSPADPDSHTKFIELLSESRATTYRKIVALYDTWLEQKPGSAAIALERCRFILAAQTDESEEFDEDVEPVEDGREDCAGELLGRYPDDASVLLFRLEQLWGDQAIEFGLATAKRNELTWLKSEGSRFCQHLAFAYFAREDMPNAVKWALNARQRDSEIDVALIMGTHLQERGLLEQAIEELARQSDDTTYVYQKVALLLELEAFHEALKVIRDAGRHGITIAALQHAQALEGAGETEAAREKYAELSDQQWNRESVLRRMLYIDLARHDGAKALASYRALRDQGFNADPLMRHRLALAVAFPLLPWQWRELLGLLGLLGVALACALAPAVLLLPAHYIGLVRAARTPSVSIPQEGWTLTRVWGLLGTLLFTDLVASYLFTYEQLHAWLINAALNTTLQVEAGARYGLLTFLLSAVAVLAWTRGTDYARLIRSRWQPGKIAAAVVVGLVAISIVQGASSLIVRALGFADEGAAGQVGIALTTVEILRAILATYGPWVMLPLVVVVVPIYEEIVFRGVFLGWASRYLPFGWANALQAVAFMLVHDAPERYPGLFAAALVAGTYARRSSGLAPAIAMHAAINLIAATALWVQPVLQQAAWSRKAETQATATPAPVEPRDLSARCDHADLEACSQLAWTYRAGTIVDKDFTRAAELHRKACDGGRAKDCAALGYLHSAGLGVPRNLVAAARLAELACDKQDATGCNNLGAAYENARGVEQSFERAAELYTKASDAGSALASKNLGMLYQTGRGVPEDQVKATELYRVACDGAFATGCRKLGESYRLGRGVAKDPALGARLTQKACDGGDPVGCNDIGGNYELGVGVAKDLAKAARLYTIACDRGAVLGCGNLARCYAKGLGVAVDLDRAAELYAKACASGGAEFCPESKRPVKD